jgi:hypothetical protein
MITDWFDLVVEGTLAKLFKSADDTKRAATHYSMFQSQRTQFFGAVAFESLGK